MAEAALQRYVVTRPFVADVGGEEIRLEPGEIIPGPRVPEIESWGRSIHFLQNTHKLAPVLVKAQKDLANEDLVADRGVDLLEHFSDDELLAELASRGVEPEAVVEDAGDGGSADETPEDAGADGEPAVEEEPKVDLMKLTRPQLNELATERGLENPAGYSTKQSLVDAIEAAAEAAAEAVVEDAGDGGSADDAGGTGEQGAQEAQNTTES